MAVCFQMPISRRDVEMVSESDRWCHATRVVVCFGFVCVCHILTEEWDEYFGFSFWHSSDSKAHKRIQRTYIRTLGQFTSLFLDIYPDTVSLSRFKAVHMDPESIIFHLTIRFGFPLLVCFLGLPGAWNLHT